MSDTANPANLASADDFDARLKRTDEDRWLATRYAPKAGRELLVAVYLLNQELQRTLQTKEPMLGKIRLQWWRETLEQIAGQGPVRRHDLAEELARLTADRKDLIAPTHALIDAFDDVLDDHLRAGGHTPENEHEKRHLAVESAVMRVAGLALDPAARPEDIAALGAAAVARLRLVAGLEGAEAQWDAAAGGVRSANAALAPAMLHLAPRSGDGPFLRRWRIFSAALTRRLPRIGNAREADL